ncbi:hypothetical protein NT239_15160 [Chitinibacter sp. SCUT-21]|uniref:hypothetical protein n=1 Tax=Chitinibacter sp. SCUT-21 TaxID=2970891 RepID=UPI0035A7151D
MNYQNQILQAIANSGSSTATSAQTAKVFQITEQSVRRWACKDTAPLGIRPVKIGNRLRWKLDDIAKVLEGGL